MKDRQSNTILSGNTVGEPLADPHDKCGPVIPSYCGKYVAPGKFKNPMPAASNTGLNNELNVEDE